MRYPKVGDKNSGGKSWPGKASRRNVVWSDFNEEDQYFGMPFWNSLMAVLVAGAMDEPQAKPLKIWEVNPATGGKNAFYNEEQKTWIKS
jgi:hypothetical protein